jgi:hypothetical protein
MSTESRMEERPADFLLNNDEKSAARRRAGEPDIYLSWGGQVYGPAGAEEVLAGLRASWFEADATFWFEGQEEWLPVAEFPSGGIPAGTRDEVSEPAPAAPPEEPPVARTTARPRRRSKGHKPKTARRPRIGTRGLLIVFAFVLLAVAVTVGILLLLMQI